MFIGSFLFFIGFTLATPQYQNQMSLRVPIMVGFFLAGLVILGGVQAWWLEPVLTRLGDYAMVGATLLTAFNDNAAVTFLASTVPNLPEAVKYSVVAGAVTGGGLTVIANAPNPAGQAILGKYFKGINPLWLFAWRLFPLPSCLFSSPASAINGRSVLSFLCLPDSLKQQELWKGLRLLTAEPG